MTRKPLVLMIAALMGLLLVWLIVVRAPQSQPVVAPAKKAVQAPPTVPTVVAPPTEPIAPRPAEIVATPAVATTQSKPPPDPPKPPPAEQQAEEANATATDETATDSDTEVSGPPEIDTDHATDLLADMIAREESTSEGDHLPDAVMQTLKKFDQESADASWSENAEQHIEVTLGEWLDALPEDAQAHLALIHVECRATLCQVLAADNDPQAQGERSAAGHEWQQAIGSLPQQPWWHELGFVDLNTRVSSADEHTLYMSYLLRETKAPPAPDVPPDDGDGGNTDGG